MRDIGGTSPDVAVSAPGGETGPPAKAGFDPAAFARHYKRFRVAERVLLTGHSHQAWPDVAFEAQQQAWLDAAGMVDDKWGRAFEVADEVRAGYRRLLDDRDGDIALGQNTHELVTRFLSALPFGRRPRLVTTDGEFHSIRRQLDRLEEEGIEVVRVGVGGAGERLVGGEGVTGAGGVRGLGGGVGAGGMSGADGGAGAGGAPKGDGASGAGGTIAERIVGAVDDRTAAVLVSSVLFRDARIVEGLDEVARACARVGAELLVDAYHSLNVVPFSVVGLGVGGAFVVGGGYKYCQLGEGNCFMRIPPHCGLRPVLTGWFAEFGELAGAGGGGGAGRVRYVEGHLRFAGSTYDPVSHYRAAAVFGFFREQGLDVERLREVSLRQVRRLAAGVDALDLDPAVLSRDRAARLSRRGGFLTMDTPRAGEICCKLRGRGVFADFRGRVLRLGPAPYVTDAQLDEAVGVLGEVVGDCRR